MSTDATLVAVLSDKAREPSVAAAPVGKELLGYATRIADPAQASDALLALHRYAWHHKGLIDVLVPGISSKEWLPFVHTVRRLSQCALRQRGLDKSVLGHMRNLVQGVLRAP